MEQAVSSVRVGAIVPSRGDRPNFLENCMRQISTQTLKPAEISVMDYEPESICKDITQRYRRGYDKLREKGLDVIALLEDDDYYSPNYLEYMVDKWLHYNKPDLLGTSYTWYYNLRLKAYFKMEHHTQSHAMSTLIKPDLNFPWCPDNEAFTDVWLWNLHSHLKGTIFTPDHTICMGMKHGVGLTGANSHTTNLYRFKFSDIDLAFLRSNLAEPSFQFFSTYF